MHGIADEESINSLLKEMEEDINLEGNTIIVNETGGGEIGGGEDKTPITVDITENGITSSSITVKVIAKGTNIGTNLTYKYYIKSTSEKTYPEVADYIGTETTYRFIELTHGAGYDIKVEVENSEGKKGVGYLTGQITNRVAGSEITGAIDFEEATWNNGLANVRVSTNTGYDIEYRKGSSGTWLPLANGGTIQDIANNTVIQVHLTDGTNTGNEATITVKDITPPTINNITVTNKTETSLQITVDAQDYESGLATSNTYTYSIDGGTGVPSNSNTNEFTGLIAGTKYLLKVEVKDRVGNKSSDMIMETTTEKEYQTAAETLKEGDYVIYEDNNGIEYRCRVMYNASSMYGLQIIMEKNANDVSLGSNNVEQAIQQYNNATKILNDACQGYLNKEIAISIRSVGSDPKDPYGGDGEIISDTDKLWLAPYSMKEGDTRYSTDNLTMGRLGIRQSSDGYSYWLASRCSKYDTGTLPYMSFSVYYMYGTNVRSNELVNIYEKGNTYGMIRSEGIRPCITLKTTSKILSGEGTTYNPYKFVN